MDTRRSSLSAIQFNPNVHAGLWLDKYIARQLRRDEAVLEGQSTPQQQLVMEAKRLEVPTIYEEFFKYWETSLVGIATCKRARVDGRMVVGLGAESVLETAVTLHRTYGIPYIPGSALKGLAASYARNKLTDAWAVNSEAYKIMFGNTTTAGYVTFFDALYVPGTGHEKKALWPDVITVHHPDYYQGNEPPADWDSPTPIPFLSATGEYLIAIGGDPDWVEKAFEILALALAEEGIGAKTSSGYGRMSFNKDAPVLLPPESEESYELAKRRLLKQEKPLPGRFRGEVALVHSSGSYGKINPAEGGPQWFVHIGQVRPQGAQLRVGQIVEYSKGKHEGRDQAQQMDILREAPL